jgi:hypothetical protein
MDVGYGFIVERAPTSSVFVCGSKQPRPKRRVRSTAPQDTSKIGASGLKTARRVFNAATAALSAG